MWNVQRLLLISGGIDSDVYREGQLIEVWDGRNARGTRGQTTVPALSARPYLVVTIKMNSIPSKTSLSLLRLYVYEPSPQRYVFGRRSHLLWSMSISFLFFSKRLLVCKFVNHHLKILCLGIIFTPKYLLIFHRSKGLQSSGSYQVSYVFLCPLNYGDFNTEM